MAAHRVSAKRTKSAPSPVKALVTGKKPSRKRKRSDGPQKTVGRGRPPLISMALTDRIAEHIRTSGMSIAGSAEFHRTLATTAYKWLEEGRRKATPATTYFFVEVTQARRAWESKLATAVTLAATADKGGPLALAALGRRVPDWTEKQQVEVIDTPPAVDEQLAVNALRNNAEARKRYAAFLEALEPRDP